MFETPKVQIKVKAFRKLPEIGEPVELLLHDPASSHSMLAMLTCEEADRLRKKLGEALDFIRGTDVFEADVV